jgi:hypothetical protein
VSVRQTLFKQEAPVSFVLKLPLRNCLRAETTLLRSHVNGTKVVSVHAAAHASPLLVAPAL